MIKELRKVCRKDEHEPLNLRFFRVFSIYLTAVFIKLGLSPNFISVMAIVSAMAGAALLAMGSYPYMVAGAVVLVFSYLLDCCDGEIARYTGKYTAYGSYLEVLYSNVLYGAAFIGLSVGTYRLLGDVNMLLFGLSAVLFKSLYRANDASKGILLQTLKQSPRHAPMALNETSPIHKKIIWEIFMSLFFGGGIVLLALLFALINKPNILLIFYGVTMPLVFLLQSYFHWLDLRGRQRES